MLVESNAIGTFDVVAVRVYSPIRRRLAFADVLLCRAQFTVPQVYCVPTSTVQVVPYLERLARVVASKRFR